MDKIDYKKILRAHYSATTTPVLVDISEQRYLAIDGKGNPNTSAEFKAAVEALYAVSYTVKFSVKRTLQRDYAVMPLEGLWWAENMSQFAELSKDSWLWTLLIFQPDFVSDDMLNAAKGSVIKKRANEAINRLEVITLHEGKSAQLLHVGPYANETENIQRLHNFIKNEGYLLSQKHHEIYLSDMRKTAPEKLKTIIRQPVIAV